MSIAKTNLLCIAAFFPIFSIKSDLSLNEIILSIFVYLIPFLILNYIILKKKLFNKFFSKLYISILIVFSADNSLGFWNGVIQPLRYTLIDLFRIIYIPAIFFVITLIILIYIVISKTDKKFLNVIIIFIFTIFIFGILDQTKSYKNLKDYELDTHYKFNNTHIILILDEMSGLNSYESKMESGSEVDKKIKNFFKKNDFEFYSNIKSISSNSVSSISALMNLTTESVRSETTRKSKNYFLEYELHKNLLFEKFSSISVFQNMHIDYCVVNNISKCRTYNPFKKKLYNDGFINTFLTKTVSLWKLNGSINSTIIFRSLRELRLIDSILEPEGEKAAFNILFEDIESDIKSKKYDLIFVHTLVPHRPYGFDKNCKYNGKLSLGNNFFDQKKHINQHNIERVCVINFLEKFIKTLDFNNNMNNLQLTILSDHGARIKKKNDNSFLSVIFANKHINTKYKEISEESTSQKIFSELFN